MRRIALLPPTVSRGAPEASRTGIASACQFFHAVTAPLAGILMRAKLIAIAKTLNTTCRCADMPGLELAIERADRAPMVSIDAGRLRSNTFAGMGPSTPSSEGGNMARQLRLHGSPVPLRRRARTCCSSRTGLVPQPAASHRHGAADALARQPGNVPSSLAACYYAQASAALIVSEATQISVQGHGTPGRPASTAVSR